MSGSVLFSDPHFERWVMPEPNSGCWLWIGGACSLGYGKYNRPRGLGTIQAHRAAFQFHHNVILPKGSPIRHKCDNPSCVNPGHLLRGTFKENTADMMARGRGWWQRYGSSIRDRGADQHLAKLCDDDIKEIRQMHVNGFSYNQIGSRFGVTKTNIYYIVRRKTWGHVA